MSSTTTQDLKRTPRKPAVKTSMCYNCEIKPLDILKVDYNSLNCILVLWNKYQVFVYENLNVTTASRIFLPDYQVERLLIATNYLIILDSNGSVHLTLIKLKNAVDQENCSYDPPNQGTKAIATLNQDLLISLRYESDSYFIYLNEITRDFQAVQKVALLSKDPWPLVEKSKDKYLLAHHKIDEFHYPRFEKMCKQDEFKNQHFVVVSFDKCSLYGCFYDPKTIQFKTNLIKLYICPSEICHIEIIGTENIYMLIALKLGTVMLFSLENLCLSSIGKTVMPDLKHLNIGLHKLCLTNDTLIYTDGVTIWKADTIFSKDFKFEKIFIKNVNSFALCEDKLICTTFNKLIYSLLLLDESSYVKPVAHEYSPAGSVIDVSKYIYNIYIQVQKNNALTERISVEGCYLAAMSLSKRPEITMQGIESSVTIHRSFEEYLTKKTKLILTEEMSNYFGFNVYVFNVSVKIKNNQDKLSELLEQIMTHSDAEVHITLSDGQKVLKTTTVKLCKKNFLIPLKIENGTEIFVDISVVPIIPGSYDKKMKVWVELYKKTIKLTAEHFIQENLQSPQQKKSTEDIFEEAILEFDNQYKSLIEYKNISKFEKNIYAMYIKLPTRLRIGNFGRNFRGIDPFLYKVMKTEDFLRERRTVSFVIATEQVNLTLEDDELGKPRLKMTCRNVKIVSDIRNYFSNILYKDNPCRRLKANVHNSFYTVVENYQKKVKECLETSASFNYFLPVMQKFEKDIISAIPV